MIVLESERLLFRQHEPTDLEAFCAMEMDADVRRFVGGHPRSRSESEQRFLTALREPAPDRLVLWASILKTTGHYVGRCGLYPHFGLDGARIREEATLAFYIAREDWGLGLATEAGHAFIGFGFGELRLKRIVATVQAGNHASVRVLNKLGFTLTATEQGEYRLFLKFGLGNPRAEK